MGVALKLGKHHQHEKLQMAATTTLLGLRWISPILWCLMEILPEIPPPSRMVAMLRRRMSLMAIGLAVPITLKLRTFMFMRCPMLRRRIPLMAIALTGPVTLKLRTFMFMRSLMLRRRIPLMAMGLTVLVTLELG